MESYCKKEQPFTSQKETYFVYFAPEKRLKNYVRRISN